MGTTITICIASAESFVFNLDGLWSYCVPGEKAIHYYHKVTDGKPPTPILLVYLWEQTINSSACGWCALRPSHSQEGLSLAIKGKKDEIAESSSLTTDQMVGNHDTVQLEEFLLRATPLRLWQSPVMLYFITGTPFIHLVVVLSGNRLRQAEVAIMSRAVTDDCHKNVASLQEQVEKLRRTPG
jgi:hypothetical protein